MKGFIMLQVLIVTISLFVTSLAWSNAQLDQFPGAVPLDHSRGISTDLVLEDGRDLTPSMAIEARENIKLFIKNGDLSYFQPRTSSLYDPNNEHPIALRQIKLKDEPIKFVNSYPTWIKSIMFEAKQGNQSYLFFASKKAHNLLLRKAMMESLGYRVPDIQWVPKKTITFPTILDKKKFLSKFGKGDKNNPGQFVGDQNLWVIENEEESTSIVMQDFLVMNTNEPIYNFAFGSFDTESDIIKGRRTLNSLLIPFSMVDVPESINLLSPKFGREFSGYAIFDYQFPGKLYPTYEDARWMARKILNLPKRDFGKIAAAAKYPPEETLILTKLLQARRDDLIRTFKIENIALISPDLNVSYGDRLKDGRLIPTFKPKENPDDEDELPEALPQPGYATRTAYGEQKSPLTKSQIFNFFRGIGHTNIISNLVTEFNTRFMPKSETQKGIQDHQIDVAVDQWAEYIRTGEVKEVGFGAYTVPDWGFAPTASRAIVIGSYQGSSDENIQLADSIGFSMHAGAFIGFDGIDPPAFLAGGAKVHFNRKYTHLKPVFSIKASLDTPFRNIAVPLFQEDLASVFDELENGNTEYLSSEEGFEKVSNMLSVFKDQFQDGESLQITDSLGASLNLKGGYSFSEIVSLQAQVATNQLTLWRTNILRQGNSIHIYKDYGLLGSISFKLSLDAYRIPIVSVSFKKAIGYAKTSFNQLSLEADELDKPGTIANIMALRSLIKDNSVEEANMVQKPYKITHKFDESVCNFQLFVWHTKCLTSKDKISVTYPDGYNRKYFKYTDGDRSGRNYQALFTDVINSLIDEFTESTYNFSAVSSGNPGDTFLGKSTTEQFSYETELDSGYPVDMFATIKHIKKGWEADKEASEGLFDELNGLYNYEFFPKDILSRTRKIQLYNISLQINFYENAILHIMEQDRESFETFSRAHADLERINSYRKRKKHAHKQVKTFERELDHYDISKMLDQYRKKLVKHFNNKDQKAFAKSLNKLVSFISKSFSLKGIKALSGGKYNIFARGQVGGFRKGDEDGDVPYITDTYGEMGSASFNGPLNGLRNDIQISDSELFARWILGYL